MEKFTSLILFMVLFFSLSSGVIYSNNEHIDFIKPEDVLKVINQDMEELYGEKNYYPDRINNRTYRKDLIQKQIKEGGEHFIIVYGGDHGPWLDHKGGMYAYSGFTKDGESVSTEGAPWYAGWSGTKIQDFNMIETPWEHKRASTKYKIEKNKFDQYTDKENIYLKDSNGTFEKSIIEGLNYKYAGQKYAEFMYKEQNKDFSGLDVYDLNATPKKGGQWIDYVHILQPPTFYSWGEGRIYIENKDGNITYLGIPIAPFVLQFDDLSAYFENIPQNRAAGETVVVRIRLNSSFKDNIETDFIWDIRTQSGQRLDVSFEGQHKENSESGIIEIPSMREKVLDAVFTMPEEAVEINFTLNETQKKPKEATYSNNFLSATIQPVKPLPPNNQEFTLDYNVLSRKVKFALNKGNAITAELTLPNKLGARWEGNATGSLEVKNNAPKLFHGFVVTNNPAVNEAAELIERKPIIDMKFKREDFGDDPLNRKWFRSPTAVIEKRNGNISFDGSVNRPYSYLVRKCSKDKCTYIRVDSMTSASFTRGVDDIVIKAKIYNGKETIELKKYEQKIDHNDHKSLKKDLYWTSEPYRYKVIRWMAHQQADNTLSDWTAVDGQYERIFTQQASGKLEWEVERSLGKEYEQGRDAAKKMTNRKDLYDKAVFATDKELQKYDYPIKSGYYFNPAGSYTFTIKTVTYKPTKDDTKDHQDLVDEIISSFRYETDLMYITQDQKAVNLLNDRLPAHRNSYSKKPAALSKENPQGVDGQLLLTVLDRKEDESRYQKDVVEIVHSQNSGEFTHEYWKNILEGYSESGTLKSKEDYKYREYVKENQHMYQITETTKVTIVINPENTLIFTHAHMPDGQYYVRAWLEDIKLSSSSNYYNVLPDLKGVTSLDEIQVTVQGSIYDDVNN